jgi:hypothetical protein
MTRILQFIAAAFGFALVALLLTVTITAAYVQVFGVRVGWCVYANQNHRIDSSDPSCAQGDVYWSLTDSWREPELMSETYGCGEWYHEPFLTMHELHYEYVYPVTYWIRYGGGS